VRDATRSVAEVGDRLGEALSETVVLVAPAASTSTIADRYVVLAIENLVTLEGGSFRLIA